MPLTVQEIDLPQIHQLGLLVELPEQEDEREQHNDQVREDKVYRMPGRQQRSVSLDEKQENVEYGDEVCAVGVQKRSEGELCIGMPLKVPGTPEAEMCDPDASPRYEGGCTGKRDEIVERLRRTAGCIDQRQKPD